MEFVRHLHDALTTAEREPAWDQDQGIVPFSAPYRDQIIAAITVSDKFIFVISPDSLDSGPCAEELAQAEAAGKQVIPLLRRPAREGQPIPETLAEPNWIFFDEDTRFDRSFSQLVEALDTDLDYVRIHTRFLIRARQWARRLQDKEASPTATGRDLR